MEGAEHMNEFGADFITIVDEDGVEYELEILSTLEYEGSEYVAVIPADGDANDSKDLEVSILKNTEENGEPILAAITDDKELEVVYGLMMDQLYEEAEGEDDDE